MITKTRIAGLLTAVVCGALIVFGVLGGLMPQLAAADSTNDQVENTKVLNEASRTQLAVLEQAGENPSEVRASLQELRKALPEDAASAAWLDELRDLEKSSKAEVTGFSVADPLLSESQQAAAQQAAAQSEGQQPTDGSANSSADASATGAGADATASPQAGADGTPQAAVASGPLPIPITVQVAGETRKRVTEFMRGLQPGPRLFLVKKMRIFEDKDHDPIIWRAVASGSLFVLPAE